MDIKCPNCGNNLVRDFDGPPGVQAQGYCSKKKCRIEVFVRRRLDPGPQNVL